LLRLQEALENGCVLAKIEEDKNLLELEQLTERRQEEYSRSSSIVTGENSFRNNRQSKALRLLPLRRADRRSVAVQH
jgi:methylmalonyl-CoA mutase N-terminal domain/subunit